MERGLWFVIGEDIGVYFRVRSFEFNGELKSLKPLKGLRSFDFQKGDGFEVC